MSREDWSAMFVIFGLVDLEFLMTINSAPADSPPETSGSPAPPSWPWRRTALLLAGAAQLITISALVSADPIAANWSSLLLAVAPALLAAVAAFAPAPVNLLAAAAGIAGLVAGIAGQLTHTGLFLSRPWWCWPSAPSSSGASKFLTAERGVSR